MRDEVRDGVAGWELVQYQWYSNSQQGRFIYEREIGPGRVEQKTIFRKQTLMAALRAGTLKQNKETE